jgi:hypothetical protein
MAFWIKVVIGVISLIIMGTAAAVWTVSSRRDRATAKIIDRLLGAPDPRTEAVVDFRRLEGLPKPVIRYFRRVLRDGQPLVHSARLRQAGEFNMGRDADSWRPFTAVQHISPSAPGFAWDARIRMAPFLSATVRDGYVDGHGFMNATLLSLITIVDARDTPELDAGALQRYLAEAVLCPTALLPSQGVQWREIDDHRAEAVLTHGRTTVSLEFRFNDAGVVTAVYTPARFREVDGRYMPTPWGGTFRRYEERGGMRIPIEGEVSWFLPGRTLTYWRGTIGEIQYEFVN